jgi:hypothetical protein
MARSDDGVVWMTCQIPWRKQCRYERTLRRAWRHQHKQPVDLASFDCLKTIEQQQVVSSRRETDGLENYTAPLHEIAAN